MRTMRRSSLLKKPRVRARYIARLLKEEAPSYLVDSTSLLAASTPIFAALETNVAGFSNENSVNARLLGTGLTFAGMGKLFTGGLRRSRKLFKIKEETTRESLINLHDAAYAVAYNLVISPPFYLLAGVRDLKQIAIGTGLSMGFALVAGGPIGYAVDSFKDLTGLEECKRRGYPELVRKQPPYIKRIIAAGLVAASIALTSGVYQINDCLRKPKSETSIVQQVQPITQSDLEQKIN